MRVLLKFYQRSRAGNESIFYSIAAGFIQSFYGGFIMNLYAEKIHQFTFSGVKIDNSNIIIQPLKFALSLLKHSIMYQSVTVFCGSQFGANPLYEQEAIALGKLLANNGIRLVYGGGNNGLMGTMANAMLANGGHVTGVMPQLLIKNEKAHTGLSTLHEAEDMHARKKLLYSLADAAIILPGGIGTLDEMFEIITWNNLTIHDKKIILLNTAGFYDHLLQHMQSDAAGRFFIQRLDVDDYSMRAL